MNTLDGLTGGPDIIYLGLGSNVGDRRGQLARAVASLSRWAGGQLRQVSSLYETAYVGPGAQRPYLNACVAMATVSSPADVLTLCRDLERAAGRAPDTHMQPRPLDVDLLLHGVATVASRELTLPHPRLAERRFVLEPLRELAGEAPLPGLECSASSLLRSPGVADQCVDRVAGPDWWREGAPA